MFDDTVEWDDRTAQLGRVCRRLSPQQMSTVDQRDSGDGWEERWSPLSTTIERAAADYSNLTESASTSSASARARVFTRSDSRRHGNAKSRRIHSDVDREAAYSGSREVRDSTYPRKKHRRAGPERHLDAEVDASKEWTSVKNSSMKTPSKSPDSANKSCAANSRPSGEATNHRFAFGSIIVKKL